MDPEGTGRPRDLEEHLRFGTLLAELLSGFVNLPSGDVDSEIEDTLRRVSEFLSIDLAVLWQRSSTVPAIVTPTHVYRAGEDVRPPVAMREEHYPWVVRQALSGRTVAVASPDDVPAEASADRDDMGLLGIKSGVCLPLSVGGGRPVGCLALNALRTPRDWPDVIVTQLQLVAQVFAGALAWKRADQAARDDKAISQATFDVAAVGIAHVGTDGRLLRVNDKLCAIVGYPREELLQRTVQDITHPDDLGSDLDHARQVLSGGIKTYSTEKRYIRRDRSLVWINLTVSLVRTAAGEPLHFISVVEDITDRKRGEAARRKSEARLAKAADLAGLGFYDVEYDEGHSFVDDRFRDLCGIPSDRLQGLQPVEFWLEHLHPDDRPWIADRRQEMFAGKTGPASFEYRYLHPIRGERWFQHVFTVFGRDATEGGLRSFGVVRDITERKRREEALRQSYAEIERLRDRLQAESEYLKAEIRVTQAQGEVTGQSAAILKVLGLVEQVAPTDSTVLVRGETGTGKELIAQAIHQLSPRRGHVMVKVNCAALPSGLVESELFGRERGAYTGALTRQVGRFEVADGSTIFLDEVGDLPRDVQVKLLRVLQDGEFERLGSPKTIKVNARVIAATNHDLLDEVRQGRFREDLYYRLNVFPIHVPPLRERAEDIPALVWGFLRELCPRMGKKITQVPRVTMDALQRYPWPGNVRELRNVIEHGVIITLGDTLRVPTLGEAVSATARPQTLADAEREHILRTLERTGWRIKGPKGAATALGLHPATLHSRMKKLGIRQKEHPPS